MNSPLKSSHWWLAALWVVCFTLSKSHAAQTTSEFDDLGRRKNETIGAEAASATVYKDRLRQTELTEPSGQISTLTVDALGRPTSETDPVGTRTWRYLRNGLVKQVTHTADGTGGAVASLDYGYDHETNATTGLGRLTRYTVRYTASLNREVTYAYDAEGRVTRLTYPGGERFVDYSYNARGRLSALRDWAGRLTLFTYDAENRLVLLQRPNGSSREVTYNTAGDLTRILDRGPVGEVLLRLDFTWDELGRLSSRTVFPKPGVRPGYSVSSLAYTGASDRLDTASGIIGGQTTATTTTITSDADANLTKALKPNGSAVAVAFDARNRVTGLGGELVDGGVAYDYDALDRRIRERRTGQRDEWLVDDAGGLSRRLVRYRQNGSGVEQSRTYYIYGPGLAYEVTETTGATPQVRYYHADQIGSTLALSDETGAVTDRWTYDPFGAATQTLVGSSTTPFLYAGQSGAVTGDFGVIHLRARDYSTVLRRFLSRDPARDGLNWFAYANGSPLNLIDPSGFGAVNANSSADRMGQVLDGVQLGLDIAGLIPGFGEIADGANVGISLARGDYLGASLSAAAMIPGPGTAATAAKFLDKADDLGGVAGGAQRLALPPAAERLALPPAGGTSARNAFSTRDMVAAGTPTEIATAQNYWYTVGNAGQAPGGTPFVYGRFPAQNAAFDAQIEAGVYPPTLNMLAATKYSGQGVNNPLLLGSIDGAKAHGTTIPIASDPAALGTYFTYNGGQSITAREIKILIDNGALFRQAPPGSFAPFEAYFP